MMLLFGGAVLAISVLILGIYLIQKSLGRNLKSEKTKAPKLNVEDEAAFSLETVKGVIAQLKAEQKAHQEKLAAAERRADENARKFELVAREIDYGLIIFDAQGFITFSNPQVRKLLNVDTLSRRRYPEIFADLLEFSKLIGGCIEAGTETRNGTMEFPASDGGQRQVEVTILPLRDRSNILEGVGCVFRASSPPAAQTVN